MELHPRLFMAITDEKAARLSVDEFTSDTNEVTHAWWDLHRTASDQVAFSVRPEFSGAFLEGSAATVAEALDRMAAFTEKHYNAVAARPSGYLYGLEFIDA